MKTQIRTTILTGFLGGICAVPIIQLSPHLPLFPHPIQGWPLVVKLYFFTLLAVYCLMLCRWSATSITAICFPLLVMLGASIWPNSSFGFLVLILILLGWIRSGICYSGVRLSLLIGEIITLAMGSGLIFILWPNSSLGMGIAVLLFFLFQALYFIIVPEHRNKRTEEHESDPFERAYIQVQRLLS